MKISSLRRRGQALIEFALISTIFLLMLLGMLQFGLYQSTANTLWNLSREGARFACTKGKPDDSSIRDRINQAAPGNIKMSDVSVAISPATRVTGGAVTVTLSCNMQSKLIFPLISKLLSPTYTTSSTMRVE